MRISPSMIRPIDFPKDIPLSQETLKIQNAKQYAESVCPKETPSLQQVPVHTWHAYNQISFGYKHPFKDIFRKGELPTVKVGLYGDILTKRNVSLEHVKPHSAGGKNTLGNYALASIDKNSARGNSPLCQFLRKDQAVTYLDQFRDVRVTSSKVLDKKGNFYTFDGNSYIKSMVAALSGEGVDVSEHFKDILKTSASRIGDSVKSVVKNL